MAKKKSLIAYPATPGDLLTDHMGRLNITQGQMAKALNVSRLTVNEIARGKRRVTADMALKLAYVLGGRPEHWMILQNDCDLLEARRAFIARKLTILEKR